MSLAEDLKRECLQVGTSANNKKDLLGEIARLAKKNLILSSVSEDDIFKSLEKREAIASTGFEQGIAIPHCSFDNIDSFVVGLITIPDGIDFKAIDGKKSRLIFFIIGPSSMRTRHIRILSSISKLSKQLDMLDRFLKCTETGELERLVHDYILIKDKISKPGLKSQFVIHIQKEELFDDILETLSAEVDGSLSVIETTNASYYLNKMPLFAAYWNENNRSFSRIIIAVVDKTAVNDTIRRINMIAENIENEPGILITVQDLLYTSGSINF